MECLIHGTNKPKWAEGMNYLTVAKRVNRASTHLTAVLLRWVLSVLKTRIQTVALSISRILTVAIVSVPRILTLAIMSNSVVHESGAREWCTRVVHESGAREWCTRVVHESSARE